MIGKTLGNRYEILKEIGNGGMARVYLAHCKLLNRNVAVKVLRPELANDPEFLNRFNTEAQAAAGLSHPNIVSVYDFGKEDGISYIVMEYVEGQTLKEYIDKNTMLPWREAVGYSIQICRALEHAHKNGVIHRDIKPHNIILTPDNVLKVTDFGIARASTSTTVTMGSNTMGSVHYFSPEQARGGYTDAKSDIYSLGVVMYEMMTGRVPFNSDSPVSIAIKHIQEKPVSPKEYNISIPLAVEAIILKAISKEQSQRYQSATQMLGDLRAAESQPNIIPETQEEPGDISGNTIKIPTVKQEDIPADIPQRRTVKHEPEKKNDEKSDKKAVVWAVITSVVLVALLIFGTLVIVNPNMFGKSSEEFQIPDLVGQNYEKIKDKYKDQKVTISITQQQPSNEYKEGDIIEQNPKPGKMVKPPLEINVIVSSGAQSITLENYANKSFSDAKVALEKLGLKAEEIQEPSDSVPIGLIIRTNPMVGSTVKPGEVISVYVSTGPDVQKLPMPNLVGLDLNEAKRVIAENNLREGKTIYAPSDKAKGIVTKQSVGHNEPVAEYQVIDITVSNGNSASEENNQITPSTSSPTNLKTKSVGINIPQDKDTTQIKVLQDGNVIHNAVHKKSEKTFNVNVTGSGSVKVEVYYNGELSSSSMVKL